MQEMNQCLPQQSLPPGFEIAFTSDGQMYYVDHNTRTTHWTIPAHLMTNQYNIPNAVPRVIDPTKRKTKLCINFANGNCGWGDKCAFAHGEAELITGVATLPK